MRAVIMQRLWTSEIREASSVPFKGCNPAWMAGDYEIMWIIAASVSLINRTKGGGHGFESCLHQARRLVSISRNNVSIIHSIYTLIKRRLPAVLCANDGDYRRHNSLTIRAGTTELEEQHMD